MFSEENLPFKVSPHLYSTCYRSNHTSPSRRSTMMCGGGGVLYLPLTGLGLQSRWTKEFLHSAKIALFSHTLSNCVSSAIARVPSSGFHSDKWIGFLCIHLKTGQVVSAAFRGFPYFKNRRSRFRYHILIPLLNIRQSWARDNWFSFSTATT